MAMINTRHLEPQPGLDDCELTPRQQTNFDALNTIILRDHPFFSFVLIEQMDVVYTKAMPTAGTDGFRIYINPDYIGSLHMQEQVFGFVHEIEHAILEHIQRAKAMEALSLIGGVPFNFQLANVAQDARINADLIHGRIGKFRNEWVYDRSVTDDETWEDIYVRYFRNLPPDLQEMIRRGQHDGGGFGPRPGWTGKQHDTHLPPPIDKRTGEPVKPGSQGMKETVIQAAGFAKAQGKFPDHMQKYVDELLDPQIPWEDHFDAAIKRALGTDAISYARPHRRRSAIAFGGYQTIWPGKTGTAVGGIIAACDTSGSMWTGQELKVAASEFAAILRDRRPEWFKVIWCDAKVHRIDEHIETVEDFENAIAQGVPGGGGTDFRPVFDAVAEAGLSPAAMVFFTDGEGRWPNAEPSYPVIWVMTTGVKPPFGEVVRVKI